METFTQHIELINQYLNNLLSSEAKESFIQKLESDSDFNQIYQEHVILVGGINRAALKHEIANAHQTYKTFQWIKISGIGIIVISILILLYTLLSTSNTENNQSLQDENSTFIKVEKEDRQNEKSTAISDTLSNIDEVINSSEEALSMSFEPFKKQSQKLTIDVSKDTIIKCKEGTILKIKANSFVKVGGTTPVTGKIDFEVTEYYKLSDMLLANLTTTSKDQQLETGGMLYIEARHGEERLELKANSNIEILMPTKNKKESMQLFSGLKHESGIDWILEEEKADNLAANAILVNDDPEENIEVPFSIVEQVPVFPGCETINENEVNLRRQCFNDGIQRFIQENFNTDIFTQLELTGRQRITSVFKINQNGDIMFIQSNGPRQELIDEANRVIGLLPRIQPGRQRGRNVTVPYSLPIIFQIQSNGTILNNNRISNRDSSFVTTTQTKINTIKYDTIYEPARGMVERIREVMHDASFEVDAAFIEQWNDLHKENLIREFNKQMSERKFLIKKEVFEDANTRFKILEDDSITRGGHVIRIPWDESKIPTTTTIRQLVPIPTYYGGGEVLTAEEFEGRVEDEDKTKSITTSDVSNYILKTSKLGWINCDRFINGRTKRIKYKLKIKNSDNTVVNMIFKSVNSILPSWKSNDDFDFGAVSENTEVILVAIKKQEGKLFLDIVDTTTTINPNIEFEFKEVSLQEMKVEFKKLNSLFD